ncbi:hypothetical protein [Pseudomonas sp. RIT357]|uniref:hypothetical protein n=1 Tax=Pseudomonas sp. RIT357 TaxID=1470593 RepID=UPI0004516761|nr:hypothetical protein [Pseudomonas sp. RIT357]EZP62713.1 hypothetical protein BW43_05168 [Pseudomonas sp. RIT357]
MQGKPRLAVNEISSERMVLWHSLAGTHVVDEFSVRRLINKIDSVLSSLSYGDKKRALLLHEQAYLHAYLMKPNASIGFFSEAEAAGLPSFAKHLAAAHAMAICGELEMARSENLSVIIDKLSADDVVVVADSSAHLGLYKRAKDLYVLAGKTPEGFMCRAFEAADIMDDSGVSDEDIFDRLSLATAVVKRLSGHPNIAYDMFALRGEGILYRFVVRASIETLVEIDAAIDEALSLSFDAQADRILSIGVMPHTDDSAKPFGRPYNVSM